MSFRRGEKDSLLSSLNASSSTTQDYYTESGALMTAQRETVQQTFPTRPPPGGSESRGYHEVEVVSGVRCTIQWHVDGSVVGQKLVKCQVFSGSTVDTLVNTIRSHWHIDVNAGRIVEGQLRFIDYLVKEMPSGALMLPDYPAALLFSDKNSNTANIEITFLFERMVKPCCSKKLKTWGFFSAFIVVRPVLFLLLLLQCFFFFALSLPPLFFSDRDRHFVLLFYQPSHCLLLTLFLF